MLKTIVDFCRCLLRLPLPWLFWVTVLIAVNTVGPLVFFEHIEGQVVLAVFAAGAGVMMVLFASVGFARILGAGHVLWLAMLPWLWSRHALHAPDEWLARWIAAVVAINGISLIIDAVDVVRYARGDRQPTISIE